MLSRLLLFLLIPVFSFSNVDLNLKDSVGFTFSNFNIDPLGKVIAFNKDSVVQFDTLMKREFVFDYSDVGTIEDVISMNGLKRILFDKQHQKVIFLDNTLSVQKEAVIPGGFGFVTSMFWSKDGKFWLYDSGQNRVLVCKQNFDVLFDSGNMELIYGFPPSHDVDFLQVDELIMLKGENNVQVLLDNNGAYNSQLKMEVKGRLLYAGNSYVHVEKEMLALETELNKSFVAFRDIEEISTFYIFKDKLYLLSNNMLYIYIIQ